MRNKMVKKLQVIYMGEKKELKIKHPEKAYTHVCIQWETVMTEE